MFYNSNIVYRGKRMGSPAVHTENAEDNYDLDPDLKKILNQTISAKSYNNEVCFWMDNVLPSFTTIIAYTIIGKGLRVTTKTDADTKAIREWCSNINVLNESIEEYIRDSIIDNVINGYSLWRIKTMDGRIDLQRVPPTTITIEYDDINGWRKFTQDVTTASYYTSYEQFLREPLGIAPLTPQSAQISIPDKPKISLYTSFFRRAPMAQLNHLVVNKRWIQWFMRKYSEKVWAPITVGYVGGRDKQGSLPNSALKMQAEVSQMSSDVASLRNFSSMATPGYNQIERFEVKNDGGIYLDYIEHINNELMFGIFGSMSMREGARTFKTTILADESIVHVMEGIRREIENKLGLFFVNNLCTSSTYEDIIFHWSPLRTASIEKIAQTIEIGSKLGVYKDQNEVRNAFSEIDPDLTREPFTADEEKKSKDTFILINAPSQPGMTTPDVANRSRVSGQKNPA